MVGELEGDPCQHILTMLEEQEEKWHRMEDQIIEALSEREYEREINSRIERERERRDDWERYPPDLPRLNEET